MMQEPLTGISYDEYHNFGYGMEYEPEVAHASLKFAEQCHTNLGCNLYVCVTIAVLTSA